MIKTRSLLIGAIALIGALSLAAPAFAEEVLTTANEDRESISVENNVDLASGLEVAPTSNRVKLIPGSALEYSIIVHNTGSDTLKFNVYAAPYTIIDENYNLSFTEETTRTQLARWIQFINDDGSVTDKYNGTVAAGEQKAVNYRITVPDSVPSGGQYAVILTQTEATEDVESAGVITVSRLGTVIYGRTDGETIEKVEVIDFNIPTFKTDGKISAMSVLKNTGNTDFEVKYTFTVTSIVGKELYHNPEIGSLILPDTQRKQEFTWEETPAIGIFNVGYKIEAYGEVIKEDTKLVMILPVYLIVITILLLTITIIWIIILIRKRKERKARLLV